MKFATLSALVLALAVICAPAVRAQETTSSATTVLDAPIADVWNAIATGDGIAKSWGVALADVRLDLGGVIRTHDDPQGVLGDATTRVHPILSFEPGRMLALRSPSPDGASERYTQWCANGWRVIRLEPLGSARTRYTESACGLDAGEETREVRARIETERKSNFERLGAMFAPRDEREHNMRVLARFDSLLGNEFRAQGEVIENLRVVSRTQWSKPVSGFLLNQSWLGEANATDLREQSFTMYGCDPRSGRTSFWRFGEGGALAHGEVGLDGEGVGHDWRSVSRDGSVRELYVTIHPTEAGYHYRAQPSREEFTTLLELQYER